MEVNSIKSIENDTIRKIPQHNGAIEWMDRTLLERERCILSTARLSKDTMAINTACYIVNRFVSTPIECKTSQERWWGMLAYCFILKFFCCSASYHVNDSKLESRAKKCIFLGIKLG